MSHDEPPADIGSLSLLQKILMVTDGTVTDLIALYAGEAITVRKLSQSVQTEDAPAVLACHSGERVLRRRILLCGAARPYLYADSLLVLGRLSASIQEQLLETDRPIGLMWKTEKLETYREVIERKIECGGELAEYFNLPLDDSFASRTYVINHQGRPMGMITEKWPTRYFREVLASSAGS